MKRLTVALFTILNMVFSVTNANDCPVLDVLPDTSSVQTANCSDCRCLNSSFPQLSTPDLKSRHLSSLQNQLQHRFMARSVPHFVQQFSEYSNLSRSCSLDQLQNVQCQEARGAATAVIERVLNLQENQTCFPDRTIERILLSSQRNLQTDLLFNGNAEALKDESNDYAMLFVAQKGLHNRFEGFDDIISYVQSPGQSEDFQSFVGDQCIQFYQDLNDLYCKPLEEFPTHSPRIQSLFFHVDTDQPEISTDLNATQLEVFALTCQQRQICSNRDDQCIGLEPLHDSFYQRRPEISVGHDFDLFVQLQGSLSSYCPLLTCRDIEAGFDVIYEEASTCETMSPPRSLAQLSDYLGCQTDDKDEMCSEDPMASVINEYRPLEDEPLRIANHSFTEEDLATPAMREYLVNLGYDASYVESLGEVGLARAFDLPLNINIKAEDSNSSIAEFLSIGAQDASEAIIAMESNIEERQAQISNDTRASFSERPRRQDQRIVNDRLSTAEPRTRSIQPEDEFSQAELREQLISGFNEAVSAARGAMGTASRSLNREARGLNEGPDVANSPQTDNRAQVRTPNRPAPTRASTREAAGGKRPLENNQAPILPNSNAQALAVPDGVNPQEWYQSQNASPIIADDSLIPNSNQGLGSDSLPSDAIVAGSSGGSIIASTGAGRSPASIQGGLERGRYLERSKDELPMLTLEDLDRIDLQQPFILGLRDGSTLMRIEFIPVDYYGEIRFRVASHQRNQISPALVQTLMTSPFFSRYLHPDHIKTADIATPRRQALL
jgi:hypothetical protein